MNKFKLVTFLLFCCITTIISSCKKKEPTVAAVTPNFTLQVKAKYGNQPFVLGSPNIDTAGRYITFSTLIFYLSHINLIKANGSTVPVANLAIIYFDSTQSVSTYVPPGSFTGISFGCGLDSNQNKATANDSILPSPYSGLWGLYWDMNSGYRFTVMEGIWAPTPNSNMPSPLVYHIGNNAAYRQTKLTKGFTVCCTTPDTLTLYLDIQQIFNNSITGESINIVTEPETSSGTAATGDNPVIMPAFADNFSNSFSY